MGKGNGDKDIERKREEHEEHKENRRVFGVQQLGRERERESDAAKVWVDCDSSLHIRHIRIELFDQWSQ